MCFGWKGGIGSASRVLPAELGGFTLGALVQSNFGSPGELVIAGVPVGRRLAPPNAPPAQSPGSIMVVLATDAPLSSLQLQRLCVRVTAGLAHTGSTLSHGSGDFVIAFSTAQHIPQRSPAPTIQQLALGSEAVIMSSLFRAVIEAVEEAVLNSLAMAQTMVGRDGHTAYALPLDRLQELLSAQGG
jgi:D-aminopeptidase